MFDQPNGRIVYPPTQTRRAESSAFTTLGYGICAFLLVAFAPTGAATQAGPELINAAAYLGWLTLPLGLTILPMLQRIQRGYVDAMRGTLVRGRFSDDLPAAQGRLDRVLTEGILSHDAPRVLFAMDRLRQLDPDPDRVRHALPELMAHASPQVRAAALRASRTLEHEARALLRLLHREPLLGMRERRRAIHEFPTRHGDGEPHGITRTHEHRHKWWRASLCVYDLPGE